MANSDYVSVVDVKKEIVVDSIQTGLFSKQYHYYGSSPDALYLDSNAGTLYVANGMDNAIAVIKLGNNLWHAANGSNGVKGYIPTEAYPSGIAMVNQHLYISNLEAKGSRVLSESVEFKNRWKQSMDIQSMKNWRQSVLYRCPHKKYWTVILQKLK